MMYILGLLPVVAFLAIVGTSSAAPNAGYRPPENDSKYPGDTCSIIDDDSDSTLGVRARRNLKKGTRLWTNRTFYYQLDAKDLAENGTEEQKNRRRMFFAGLERIVNHTCLNGIESSTAPDRIYVFERPREKDNSCGWSYLGMRHGVQELSVHCWWDTKDVIHELMHALGVIHTQSRPDRDEYLLGIDASEVGKSDADLFVPYDYASIMHYRRYNNLPDPDYRFTVGASYASFFDILNLNLMYKCYELCPKESSAKCKNGGYPNPKNCQVCNCPHGYGGPLCDRRPYGCGATLEAKEEWTPLIFELDPPKIGEERNEEFIEEIYTFCNYWITAPVGKRVEVRIVKLEGNYACVERKYLENATHASPRYCADSYMHSKPVTSPQNLMPVVVYAVIGHGKFHLEYRIRSVPQEVTDSFVRFQKNLNLLIPLTDEKQRLFTVWEIFQLFPNVKYNGIYRDVKETWICSDSNGKRLEKIYISPSGSVYEADYEKQLLTDLQNTKATHVENFGNTLDEKKEGEKTIYSKKWSFFKGQKRMICEVSLLFGKNAENMIQMQKMTVECPLCIIQ